MQEWTGLDLGAEASQCTLQTRPASIDLGQTDDTSLNTTTYVSG
eukprot:COSAG01_NODE_27865_length_674_cov_654.744348_2_plen_43_part_01